jgi:hypothetical protein
MDELESVVFLNISDSKKIIENLSLDKKNKKLKSAQIEQIMIVAGEKGVIR